MWPSRHPVCSVRVWSVSHTVLLKLQLESQSQSNCSIQFNWIIGVWCVFQYYCFTIWCYFWLWLPRQVFNLRCSDTGVSHTKEIGAWDNSCVLNGRVWLHTSHPDIIFLKITNCVNKLTTFQPYKWWLQNRPHPCATHRCGYVRLLCTVSAKYW